MEQLNFILGMMGNIGFFYGAIAFTKKHISAWYAQIIANLFYVAQSIIMNNTSLLILSIVLSLVNVYGIYSWSKKDKRKTSINNESWHRYVIEMMKHNEDE
jgi:nicotinamide riboside transporter PnuC